MIGWINNWFEAYIVEKYGEQKFVEILKLSGVPYPWVSSCPVGDEVTYSLLCAMSQVLEMKVEDGLEAFGVTFINYIGQQGYTKLTNVLGSNLIEFLDHLNHLHVHLAMEQQFKPPSFRCAQVTPKSVNLHYYSSRPGLWPIAIGMLKGLAKSYFDMVIDVEIIQSRRGDSDHEVFRLTYPYQQSIKDHLDAEAAKAAAAAKFNPGCSLGLSAPQFPDLYPFHILMDQNFVVKQCGHIMARLIPGLLPGCQMSKLFVVRMPQISGFKWSEVEREAFGPFLLQAPSARLEFKGAMVITTMKGELQTDLNPLPENDKVALFLGSPRCLSLADMQDKKLFISDIPLHDMITDFILMADERQAGVSLKDQEEMLVHQLKAKKRRTDALVARMSNLLSCLPEDSRENSPSQPLLDPMAQAATPGKGAPAKSKLSNSTVENLKMALGNNTTKSRLETNEQICLSKLIGQGATSKVYLGLWLGSEVAIKTIIIPIRSQRGESQANMAMVEAAISSSLLHPNVVQTYTFTMASTKDNSGDKTGHRHEADDRSSNRQSMVKHEHLSRLHPRSTNNLDGLDRASKTELLRNPVLLCSSGQEQSNLTKHVALFQK
eukprot:gene27067-2301_t